MRRPIIALLVPLTCLFPLTACSAHWDSEGGAGVPATGSGTTRSYAVAGFTGVDLRGSDDVDVRVGPGFSIRAEGPSDALDKLRIVREGDTLKVGRQNNVGITWGNHRKARIFVTMPRIAEAAVSGSGNLHVDRVTGPAFHAAIAGSGGLTVAALQVGDATLSMAGSGDLHAVGTAAALDLSMSGSGNIDAAGLTTRRASVSVAGSGTVRATVVGQATVSMMGSGNVDLGPQSRCKTTKMGSGSIRCGG